MECNSFDFDFSDQYTPGKELAAWNWSTVGIVMVPVYEKPI
jgi:hypothetical protein